MEHLDRAYTSKKHIQLNTNSSRYGSKQDLGFRRSSSVFDPLSPMKPMRTMRQSDGVMIIPTASTFFPIQEISKEATRQAMNIVKVREQDDYDEGKSTHVTHT